MASTVSLVASEYPIKAVTIFSSQKAEVVRSFPLDLGLGQNELTITALPSCIDVDSVRVTGLGDAVLFDVSCKILNNSDLDEDPAASSDTLHALERRLGVLHGEKTLRGHAADILVHVGKTLSAENNPIDVVDAFLDRLVLRGSATLGEAETIDAQIAELEKEIGREKRKQRKERQRGATHGRVSAVVMAKRSGRVDVLLTYMVGNAAWSPSYDLHASTEDGRPSRKVSLHYRASIQQNTGEDWRNASISVSTAMPSAYTSIPSLRPMHIRASNNLRNILQQRADQHQLQQTQVFPAQSSGLFRNQAPSTGSLFANQVQSTGPFGQSQVRSTGPSSLFGSVGTQPAGQTQAAATSLPVQSTQSNTTSFGGPSVPGMSGFSAFGVPSIPPPDGSPPVDDSWTSIGSTAENEGAVDEDMKWTNAKAVVTESAVASSFRIEGNCTIPSESFAHKVAISVLQFDAKINYVAIPRSIPATFLQCEVANSSEYRLLPGPVHVFLDNSPVSKTSIRNIVSPDDIFECTLGPDPSLRIKYTRMPRIVTTSPSTYSELTTSTTYKLCTSVQNTHPFPVRGVVIRDAAPIPPASYLQNSNPNANTSGIKVLLKQPKGLSEAAADKLVDVTISKHLSGSSAKVRWSKNGGEKEGKYEWVLDVGAGEEVKLDAEYEVRAPSDYRWEIYEEPVRN